MSAALLLLLLAGVTAVVLLWDRLMMTASYVLAREHRSLTLLKVRLGVLRALTRAVVATERAIARKEQW